MTQLLISVTSVEEAQLALENGADFIDLKDPTQGALGALPIEKIQEITAFVHAQTGYSAKLVSATIGDLPMHAETLLKSVTALANAKVDIIKIGFFETDDYHACLKALMPQMQKGLKLIAVLFAEFTYPDNLIAAIKAAGFYGLMIDTAHKNGRTLLDYIPEHEMQLLATRVQSQGLIFGLAGSLNIQHLEAVRRFNPGYIGFRGGVSIENQRTRRLDAGKIRTISKLM